MTRVDELQKKYPTLPREVIVKWEALRNGIRDIGGLDSISMWAPAAGSYQSYDHDTSLREVAVRDTTGERAGLAKRPPGMFFMKNGLGSTVHLHSKSPYTLRELSEGKFALFEGEEKVQDVYFAMPKGEQETYVTSKGTPVSSLVSMNSRNCFFIFPVRHCEYFNTNEQCKFCNFNATQEDARAVGIDRARTIQLDDALEAYKIISSNIRLVEGRFELGGMKNSSLEVRLHLDFVEKIASATPYHPNIHVHTQPTSKKDMQRLKEVGCDSIGFLPEIWDPEIFAEVCPGKAKYHGFERFKETHLEAVEVFGAGNVESNFVGGVTLIPENGHKTWQEARDTMVEGLRWMIKNGALPTFTALRLPPGSFYGANPANRDKYPPTEFYLESAMAHHKAMLEYGMYAKENKLMACPMECLHILYGGEIGILEQYGDLGNWISDAIPQEQNWLANFIASTK